MPRRVPEETRQAVLADLKATPPLSYRQIGAKHKVSQGTVNDVAQEAGLLKKRTPTARPSAARPGPSAPPGGGDGLTEYNPPAAPPAREHKIPGGKPARQGCSACGARWEIEQGEDVLARCPKCNAGLAATAPEDEIYGCGHCGARWQLDKDDKELASCPRCGVKFHG